MTELSLLPNKMAWAKSIARYYVSRGREFSVEINPILCIDFLESLLLIGVKKFYFPWRGITDTSFFYAFNIIALAQSVLERYDDVEIYIVYIPRMDKLTDLRIDLYETSISMLASICHDIPRLHCMYRRPHPYEGDARYRRIRKLEDYINKFDENKEIVIEPICGCTTIVPNGTIYVCPYCKRWKRPEAFGNVDRDKFSIGSINRGIFRKIKCDVCFGRNNGKRKDPMKRMKYVRIGG